MANATTPTIYFGYGSNLWQNQMLMRCPTSEYLGVARLDNYRWMINDRGYANVVQIQPPSSAEPNYANVVYGLVYSLQPSDEARLDDNEGVPVAYTKEDLPVSFWPKEKEHEPVDLHKPAKKQDMLVYISRKHVTDSKPKHEYIYRMNQGINDALKEGVPKEYVQEVMRKFIPPEHDDRLRNQAVQQAISFQDEI
jgi:gamma-glutamylcyclotransferase